MTRTPVSVVVCTRNEERRIEGALKAILTNDPDEIIVVDGNSTDRTREIAARYATKVIRSERGGLTWDRQVGIDAARNDIVAMIDADHVLVPGDIDQLLRDMEKYDFDIVQSQIISHKNDGFWNAAEEQAWEVMLNTPGPRKMIGTAPALYRKCVFDKVRFDGNITAQMDDTDFCYRLEKAGCFKYGIGEARIRQLHFGDFGTYLKKFLWYGKGDAEFTIKHPERTHAILFHQLVRYPLVHSARALAQGELKAVPFFVAQGFVRFAGLVSYFSRRAISRDSQMSASR